MSTQYKNFNEIFYLFVFLRLKFPVHFILSVHLDLDLATFQVLSSHVTSGYGIGQLRYGTFLVPGRLLHSPFWSLPLPSVPIILNFLIPFQFSLPTHTLYLFFPSPYNSLYLRVFLSLFLLWAQSRRWEVILHLNPSSTTA